MTSIDLNADLGEGGGHDAELMPLVTSANIACGWHAGDEATMRATVRLAQRHGVSIGAHPGYADRTNFGRVELGMCPLLIKQMVAAQASALRRVCAGEGAVLRHVKPHGALYNLAARDRAVAHAVAVGVAAVDPGLILVGLAGGVLLEAGRVEGLSTAAEAFADRTYQPDGSLTPRSSAGAVIESADACLKQALRIVRDGEVLAIDGSIVRMHADTICVHGDGPNAVSAARRVREGLEAAGVRVRPLTLR